MTEILLANEDITVLGPPETVELLVDIGPTGTRGSQIFVGVGDPNLVNIGQTAILNDMYINTSPGENYGYMYQYVSQPGGNVWIQVLRINPTIYSKRYTTTFTAGEANITIPINNIVTTSGSALTADNFHVQYSLVRTNPVASAMNIPVFPLNSTDLVINISASELLGTTWQDLSGEVMVHLFITIVL